MRIWLNIISVLLLNLIIVSCSPKSNDEKSPVQKSKIDPKSTHEKDAWYDGELCIKGNAQGTSFVIKTTDDSLYTSPKEISDFFKQFDQELSTYKDSSLISKLNNNVVTGVDLNKTMFFKSSFYLSKSVSDKTKGAFDPTVFPLVQAWGFFKDAQDPPSSATIDSVMQFVGIRDSLCFYVDDKDVLVKGDDRSKLDFNAIAQGQSVDEIAKLLEERGQENYFIEVGGEIRVKGKNDRGTGWVIGIDQPLEKNDGRTAPRELENYLELTDNSVATSGSYRKYYIKDGQKYSHTIDPKTGQPVQHNLLSVTVITEEAAVADAYATAFMTLGVEESLAFVERHPALGLNVYLLFENNSGRIERAYSEGMSSFFLKSSK